MCSNALNSWGKPAVSPMSGSPTFDTGRKSSRNGANLKLRHAIRAGGVKIAAFRGHFVTVNIYEDIGFLTIWNYKQIEFPSLETCNSVFIVSGREIKNPYLRVLLSALPKPVTLLVRDLS